MTEKQLSPPRPNRVAAFALIAAGYNLDVEDPEFQDRIRLHSIDEDIAEDIEAAFIFDNERANLTHEAAAFKVVDGPADQWLGDFGPKRFYADTLIDIAEWIVEQQAKFPLEPANGNGAPDLRLEQWPTEQGHLPFLDHLDGGRGRDWIVYHTGGGCTAYMLEIKTATCMRQILVSIEADAATDWVSEHKDFPWISCAYDNDGEWIEILVDPDFKSVAAAVASWINANQAA